MIGREIYQVAGKNLLVTASQSRNGLRLRGIPELRDDIPFCLQRNFFDFAAAMNTEGKVVKI